MSTIYNTQEEYGAVGGRVAVFRAVAEITMFAILKSSRLSILQIYRTQMN